MKVLSLLGLLLVATAAAGCAPERVAPPLSPVEPPEPVSCCKSYPGPITIYKGIACPEHMFALGMQKMSLSDPRIRCAEIYTKCECCEEP